jgi:2-polyprenyl-3-methyl-5-hydroxy-6-metoxy-1,4-benzoquinol methylase
MSEINTNSTPLHTMNPLSRFSDRVADYVKYRLTYPEAAIALILAGLDNSTQLIAADIGAGTGISSRLLAERGVQCISN